MASINTVLSASDTNTNVDNNALNPTVVNTTGRHVVHVTLIFDGVDYIPDDIFDALNAEYGTVATNKPLQGHGMLEFVISA